MFQPCPYTVVTRYSPVYDRHIHLDGDFFKGRNNVFLDWYVLSHIPTHNIAHNIIMTL